MILSDYKGADLFDELPVQEHTSDAVALVFVPGAALAPHDVLWYMTHPSGARRLRR